MCFVFEEKEYYPIKRILKWCWINVEFYYSFSCIDEEARTKVLRLLFKTRIIVREHTKMMMIIWTKRKFLEISTYGLHSIVSCINRKNCFTKRSFQLGFSDRIWFICISIIKYESFFVCEYRVVPLWYDK